MAGVRPGPRWWSLSSRSHPSSGCRNGKRATINRNRRRQFGGKRLRCCRYPASPICGRSRESGRCLFGFQTHAPCSPKREDRRAAEQYRIIHTRIFHQLPGSSITVISSPGMGDGKTVTAVNLAAALAHKSEDKIILIDADLRLSRVHERLGIPKTPGLAEVLSGACTLEDAMLRVEQLPNFYILPAGQAEANPTELLDSSNWRALLARLREEFRRTIVDSPPVEAVADYDLIAANCDGVVLVVRPDHTSRPLLARALTKVKGKLIGVLINDVEDWFLWKRGSPSYHYYQNSSRGKEGPKAAK